MENTVINLEFIKSFDPCSCGLENFIKYHEDFEGSVLELLQLDNISFDDKLWLVTQEGVLPEELVHRFAIQCAYSTLHNFESIYPDDKRPRQAIEAKEAWLKGDITLEELNAARSAAWSAESAAGSAESAAESAAGSAAWSAESAADAAAWSAARSAARSDARSDAAAGSAAWSAAWSAADAARSAEKYKQLNKLIEMVKELN